MSERSGPSHIQEYSWLTPEQYNQMNNRLFVASLLRTHEVQPSALEQATLETCTEVLDLVDRRFGRNTASLGTQTLGGEGMWGLHGVPTTYHNGDGTRLALLGAASYMDFDKELQASKGRVSPYTNRRTYLSTLLTAVYDDVVFGTYGRGGDEKASAQFAAKDLARRGFPPDIVNDVTISILASTFNEATAEQSIDKTKGAVAIQVASVTGDLWALGTAQAPLNTLLLAIEDLWKRDTAQWYGQVLKVAAVNAWDRYGWNGSCLADFVSLIDSNDHCRKALGKFLSSNPTFILNLHSYPDEAVNNLMAAGKRESATLQAHLGRDLQSDNPNERISAAQAFHCALSYAHAKKWEVSGHTIPAALPGRILTEDIGATLLTRRSLDEIAHPASADPFYMQYRQEMKQRGRIPEQRRGY